MKTLLSLLLLATLTACSPSQEQSTYQCNEQTATLVNQNEQQATLKFNDQEYQLEKERSASGVKYSNEELLFWSKGEQAMLIIDGEKYQCELQS